LLKLLEPGTRFIEPCCGADRALVGHLESAGHVCVGAYDLPVDARTARYAVESDVVAITNIPWRRRFEPNKIIVNLSDQMPLWALVYSDWLFTTHASTHLPRLRAIAAIGRVKWVPDSEGGGFENAAWCLFDKPDPQATVRVHGRVSFIRTSTGRKAA
jgi:hypothetical protein